MAKATSQTDATEGQSDHERVNMRNLQAIAPDPAIESLLSRLSDIAINKGRGYVGSQEYKKLLESIRPRFPPPRVLPCANVQVKKYWACPNPGTAACSACRLVSYCSQECQKAHWTHHKGDCKSPLRTTHLKPSRESSATPAGGNEMNIDKGVPLWGNIPAMDVIKLDKNENDDTRDLFVAFAASGDIRHLLATVNSLPESYSGHLTVVLNDHSPWIVARNIMFLIMLSKIDDIALAADIALHYWYSVFIPQEYRALYGIAVNAWLDDFVQQDGCFKTKLVNRTSACFLVPQAFMALFRHYSMNEMDVKAAQAEYNRVRELPIRQPERNVMYSGLRPSHRVAFKQYRRFGVILPHGAMNAHFNTANISLFFQDGKWLQRDYDDPLEGWDIDSTIQCGKRYGATAEDIYGCFYFMITEQLRTFAKRLRKFRLTFNVCGLDAVHLAEGIRKGTLSKAAGLGANVRFDRIHVSNIMDLNYVGIDRVLTAWGPLLSTSKHAVILAYFMNWSKTFPSGCIELGEMDDFDGFVSRMIREGKALSLGTREVPTNKIDMMRLLFPLPMHLLTEMTASSDTSTKFEEYLKKQRFYEKLGELRLMRREKHIIGPHRIHGLIDALPSALPVFASDESYYHNMQLTSYTWTERFIEIVRAN